MNINKRGISAVIATVLIILITIAAVAIIWAAIIPMLQGTIRTGTSCLTAETQLEIVPDYSCINTTTNVTKLQIRSGSKTDDVGLTDIEVIFDASGTSKAIKISNSTFVITSPRDVPSPNNVRLYEINMTNVTIAASDVTGVQIAPIILKGTTQETCNPGTMAKLSTTKC